MCSFAVNDPQHYFGIFRVELFAHALDQFIPRLLPWEKTRPPSHRTVAVSSPGSPAFGSSINMPDTLNSISMPSIP